MWHGVQELATSGVSTSLAGAGAAGVFRRTLNLCVRKPLGLVGAGFVALVVVTAVAAPWLAPYGPKDFVGPRLSPPSRSFPLGTNSLGQDMLSRTIYGAQISVAVGLVATSIAVATGTVLGLMSGYFGGWVDLGVQRVMEALASVPPLVLVLVLVAVVGRPAVSSSNIVEVAWQLRGIEVTIGLVFVFSCMRVIRSAVLRERAQVYTEAAKAVGATDVSVIWRHVLPNVLPYTIVLFSTIIGSVILTEAALAFLGYGVPSGTPSWGLDLGGRNREFFVQRPTMMLGPALALSVTVMSVNFVGDALRDLLDPRLRGAR